MQQGSVISRVDARLDGDAERLPVRAERTDNHLVELVIAGDATAFEEIFERHKRLVAIVASRHFRRHEEIEEIVQTAFAKAFVEMPRFRGTYDRSFSSWLVTITSNACIDTLRRQKVRPERLNCDLSEHEAETLLNLVPDGSKHADEMLANSDLAEKLLSHLNSSDRNLLEMLYAQELSVAEIAERQNCSKANIKIRAWRARGALRKILKKFV